MEAGVIVPWPMEVVVSVQMDCTKFAVPGEQTVKADAQLSLF